MRILFVGDVVGKIGRRMVNTHLTQLKKEHHAQVAIVNGENAAHGKGITKSTYKEILSSGADIVTLGNHAFAKREVNEWIDDDVKLIRPLNYPPGTPGKGYKIINVNGTKLMIINLQGRAFMPTIDCPFRKIDELLDKEQADMYIVDFHSETTSEALAMGYYLDGRVNAVIGTHTHVQTNDAMRLEKGTLYITDVGMTGFNKGILGIQKDEVIRRFITGLPERHVVPDDGPGVLSAVIIDTDKHTIKTIQINE
ncbi:MAG TPA: TIGR00282 family metallophosphoesterase [Aliicoccus persicus]|uniref:TIGR00282 family metallophosphoesterase n=1 Tax=Aliicoccus persicus TaxID=930138 RepID=A0A921JD41_9STAP|nr:TIGR00282 family metallophosphoesterase [Aliicoccus persicus]